MKSAFVKMIVAVPEYAPPVSVNDWLFGHWCYGSADRSYVRARHNEARAAKDAEIAVPRRASRTLEALRGEEDFSLGTLADGTPVRVAPREIGRHAMVWGSSGAGKSYALHLLTEGWTRKGRRLELNDPKGETFLLKAAAAAAQGPFRA